MRAILALLLLVFVSGAAAIWWWSGRVDLAPGGAPRADTAPSTAPAAGAPASPRAPDDGTSGARTAAAPDFGSSVATTAAEPRQPSGLANAPTAFLRVVDAQGEAPIAGAAVHRYHKEGQEAAIAYADERGDVALPLDHPEQLVVAAQGYLLRLAPTQLGSTAREPQLVRLYRDRFSRRCTLQFVLPDGTTPGEVLVQFRSPAGAAGTAHARRQLPPPAALASEPAAVQRAWQEHQQIAALQALPEVHVQLGPFGDGVVHRLAGEDVVAFAADGVLQLLAATRTGHVAATSLDPAAGAGRRTTIRLLPGRVIEGRVRTRDGRVLDGARVTVLEGDPLGLVATSDGNGVFRLGPLPDGEFALEARHRECSPLQTPPIRVGSRDVELALEGLPPNTVRGRVRSRPSLQPIGGASIAITGAGGQPVTATSEADGWFAVAVHGDDAVRVNVTAPQHELYSELLQPGAGTLDFDLLPSTTEARLRGGMTGVLAGVVVDAAALPVAGATVTLRPDAAATALAAPDRRVLTGGTLALPLFARTGGDGSFRIETEHLGGVTLSVAAAGSSPSLHVEVVPGKTTNGLRLVVGR